MKTELQIGTLEDGRHDLAPQIDWSHMGCRDHFVQFYENDSFLVDSISGFIGAGFRSDEAAIVIATPSHRAALDARLKEERFEPAVLRASGRYVALDAAETLAMFMTNGMPDRDLFDLSVGCLVRKAAREGRPVRAFGEMVALLWRDGNEAAAIRLEELWNELARTWHFSLFCAYPMAGFRGEQNGTSLVQVCSYHSRVIPAESYAIEQNADDRLRAIALLEQKAASLEAQIAGRQRVESALRNEQTRLAMAVGVAQLGIWELNLVTDELKCSDQCKAHFGLRPREPLTVDGLCELVHPDDRESLRNSLHAARSTNGDHNIECRVLDAKGKTRWISMQSRSFHNGEHRMTGVTFDITSRKEAAEILEHTVAERTEKLKETVGELEAFAYSISHDMRAPLRSIQGFAAMLMEDCGNEFSNDARMCLQRISSSAARMDRLIQDVLTFSRVARADFTLEHVDPGHLIKTVIDSYPNLQPPKATITIEGKLPTVLGNTTGLTQCLSNLLSNAVKFVAHGVHPMVRVWAEPLASGQTPFVRLYVQDNGIGIPAEVHNKIFEIFQRLSTKYEGTGIGLAIVKKAVERMGGKVGLQSIPGSGSTFWLDLRTSTT